MKQIATTKEQGQRLMACGIGARNSDMCLHIITGIYYTHSYLPNTIQHEHEYVPAWSLSRLLDIIPMSIIQKDGTEFYLQLTANPNEEECYQWDLSYSEDEDDISLCYQEASTPIEACVRMVEWLTKQGYGYLISKQYYDIRKRT